MRKKKYLLLCLGISSLFGTETSFQESQENCISYVNATVKKLFPYRFSIKKENSSIDTINDSKEKPILIKPLDREQTFFPGQIRISRPWNVQLDLSFIYWQAQTKGFDIYFYEDDLFLPDFTISNIKTVEWKDKYQPGYKIGLGINFRNSWELFAEYTQYWSHKKISGASENLFTDVEITTLLGAGWITSDAADTIVFGKAKKSLSYESLSLSLRKSFYLGYKTILIPFLGLASDFTKLKINVANLLTGVVTGFFGTAPSSHRSQSWSIGPRVGLDAKYFLVKGLHINFNSAFALQYLHFDFHDQFAGTFAVSPSVYQYADPICTFREKTSRFRPSLELGIKLAYGSYLFNKSCNVDLSLGYDFKILWDQLKHGAGSPISGSADPGFKKDVLRSQDLILHGLTCTLSFNF